MSEPTKTELLYLEPGCPPVSVELIARGLGADAGRCAVDLVEHGGLLRIRAIVDEKYLHTIPYRDDRSN